jgi:hypothetical protein
MRATVLLLLIAAAAHAQVATSVRDVPARPLAPANDPVNQQVAATTEPGLVIVLTIDGNSIHLERATPARVPKRSRDTTTAGDRVTAVGYAAGAKVASTTMPDAVVNVQEGVGMVRVTRRQVIIPMSAPRALDTVVITAPATGATARIDVRAAYAEYCRGGNKDRTVCPE